MADVLLFLWEHIWQTIIIVLGMQAVFVYKKEPLINCVNNFLKISDTIDSRESKYDEILQKLEVGKKSQFRQKFNDLWAVQLYFAIAWVFHFLIGWTKSEDKTIQEKLDARSIAFKNTLADNCEIGMYTHSVKDIEEFTGESMMHTAYRFSVVDLFVEKAIVILEKQARPYKLFGVAATVTATLIILVGMLLASVQSGIAYEVCKAADFETTKEAVKKIEKIKRHTEVEANETLQSYMILAGQGTVSNTQKDKNSSNKNEAVIKALVDRETNLAWKDMTVSFIKSFTFYGLLVLSAVFLKPS